MLCAVSPYSVLDPLFSIPHKNDKNRSMFVACYTKTIKEFWNFIKYKNVLFIKCKLVFDISQT